MPNILTADFLLPDFLMSTDATMLPIAGTDGAMTAKPPHNPKNRKTPPKNPTTNEMSIDAKRFHALRIRTLFCGKSGKRPERRTVSEVESYMLQ